MSTDTRESDPLLDALRAEDPLLRRDGPAGSESPEAEALLERILTGPDPAPESIFPDAPLHLHQAVDISVEDGVAMLRFDDGRVNVLDDEILAAFEQAIELCEAEPSIGALILVGRPGYFSAGLDRGRVLGPRGLAMPQFAALARCTTRILAAEIPVVAACTGHAIAAGAFLLLAADVRVGVLGPYRVGFNETAIGLPFPGWGRELAQTRLAALHVERATLGAQLYAPEAALDAGFLEELVEPADLERVARERAAELAREGRDAYATRLDTEWGGIIARMERRWRTDLRI